MSSSSVKVLCVTDYYLPGFKGGGPIRTIANLRKLLANAVDISIFTRDRDLGSTNSYDSIEIDSWSQTESGKVYYASPRMFGLNGFRHAIRGQEYDLIYLNSFFGFRSSIQIYIWCRLAKRQIPVLLAPRGEFSTGALSLKYFKKRVYLLISRVSGIYRGVSWHASTLSEKEDILRQFATNSIYVAEDPVDPEYVHSDIGSAPSGSSDALRLVFISRISRMKNLDALLEVVAGLPCQTVLDIYGPIEDAGLWEECQRLMADLPENIRVSYRGVLSPDNVSAVFACYDAFAFPTRGENFGHVIFESLRAGTPVLISDRTPWKDDVSGAVTVLPIDSLEAWRNELLKISSRCQKEKESLRHSVKAFAVDYARKSETTEKNISMFYEVANKTTS